MARFRTGRGRRVERFAVVEEPDGEAAWSRIGDENEVARAAVLYGVRVRLLDKMQYRCEELRRNARRNAAQHVAHPEEPVGGKPFREFGEDSLRVLTGKFFMGAKFALFNYATKEVGGLADFDYFRVDAPLHEVR